MSEQKALTVVQRAVVAIGLSAEDETKLIELAGSTKDITTITNADGRQQVHAARMVLKNQRLDITERAKKAREDAKEFSKAVISEEKRIVGIIETEEVRLQALQDAWDAAREAEKQARIAAEMQRVADLQERVAELRGCPTLSPTSGSALIADHIGDLERIAVDDSFQEFREQAEITKAAGLQRLRDLHAAAVAHETEQARIQAEREELARLREEQAMREAADRARLAEEERRAKEQRDREAEEQRRVANLRDRLADLRAQATIPGDWPASKIAAQFTLVEGVAADSSVWQEFTAEALTARTEILASLQSLHAAAVRREAEDKRIREQQAELDRQRQEQEQRQAEIERREREAQEAEARRIATERAETARREREAAEQRAREERRQKARENPPPAMDIVKTVSVEYGVEIDIAMEWLTTLDFSEIDVSEAA